MITEPKRRSHSATVELSLNLAGRVVPLWEVGPNFVVLRTPERIPPGPAEVVVSIDGTLSQRSVELHAQSAEDLSIIQVTASNPEKPPNG